MKQISDNANIFIFIVILVDLLFINGAYLAGAYLNPPSQEDSWLYWNISYVIAILAYKPVVQNRFVKTVDILHRSVLTSLVISIVFTLMLFYEGYFRLLIILTLFVIMVPTVLLSRALCKSLFKHIRMRNIINVVYVGSGVNMQAVHTRLVGTIPSEYNILGYFNDKESTHLPHNIKRLGNVADVCDYIAKHDNIGMLFCNVQSHRSREIINIMSSCENHLVRFYSVPNVRNYVHKSMEMELVSDVPVLTIRHEPLRDTHNRLIKRLFDIIVSGIFLITCFWWIWIIVGIITKITMPGPVFFRQKRNGLNGKEFYCLKFRSMKVNADADRLQATKNDPRKTKWGDIMRKTNIDELPQFINVLLGDMSIVGPRPHMLKHTKEYSAIVDRYMVRHFAKPGITGWAQVTGSRGETSEVWMMEERIDKDIWYIEHWSFFLDIFIIYKTVANVIFGQEKGNAY